MAFLDGQGTGSRTEGDGAADPEEPEDQGSTEVVRYLRKERKKRADDADHVHDPPGAPQPCLAIAGDRELNDEFGDEDEEDHAPR